MKWRRKRKYRKRSLFAFKLKQKTVYTVGAVWLWILAAGITLSFFGEGVLLNQLRDSLIAKFGWTYYLFPPLLVSLSFLFFKVKTDMGKSNVSLGLAIVIFSLIGLTQAGETGQSMWEVVANSISPEGAVLIFLGTSVVGCIILFNTSLDRFINFLLVGMQALSSFVKDMLKKITAKRDTFNPKQIPLKIEKAPVIPPPIPSKETVSDGTKQGLTMKIPPGSTDVEMWEYPPLSLLLDGPGQKADRGDTRKNAGIIEKTLDSFGIAAKVIEVNSGPAVTQYALEIALGTKVSKITSLSSDLALMLAAPTGQVRIEAPIPGRNLVGIEIPNRGLEFVTLKHMLASDMMRKSKNKLSVALGLDVSGNPIMADISKMPHVLVAGTTGSGKSVLINSWICSLLFRTTPQEVNLIMVDPKRVELTGYNGIPHLLTPVIVEPNKILSALRWAMNEMENRYKQFAEVGVRNIDGFNELSGFQAMPYIIIFIDELADLMAYAPVEVEDAITRLAQMARATGIHLVVATQRPSVDVITGLIKANIPSRIAFNVSSMVDSRVIIDMPGAEKLLGRGDMLYIPPDQSKPSRIQGTFVSDNEVKKVVEFLKSKNFPTHYTEEVTSTPITGWKKGGLPADGVDSRDQLFENALRLVCQFDKASASLLQRRLSIGYARAARIIDQLESAGVIGQGEGSKPRDVLVKNPDEFLALQNQQETS